MPNLCWFRSCMKSFAAALCGKINVNSAQPDVEPGFPCVIAHTTFGVL
jgi:hypothetical protein